MSVAKTVVDSSESWPALPLSAWADTYATLHMWTQIVGKVRLALCPRASIIGGKSRSTSMPGD